MKVITTAASAAALAEPTDRHLWNLGGGGAVLAALLLFCIPFRRRWLLMLALLLVATVGAIGCGGGGGGIGSSIPGNTAGSYTFTVTGTDSVSAMITTSTKVSVTVQ